MSIYHEILQKKFKKPDEAFFKMVSHFVTNELKPSHPQFSFPVDCLIEWRKTGKIGMKKFWKLRNLIAETRYNSMITYNCSPESEHYHCS